MSISLGLAENYAMLGSKFIYLANAGDVKGFMGSDFLSYPPGSNIDSNGIELYGTIPNAPIVNGAAAKQAIEDVNDAITQYLNVTPDYPPTAGNDLDIIINGLGPGRYTINGNLTNTNGLVTLSGLATDIYVFNVTGNIKITNNISLSGGLLPQNVIFIASDYINIGSNVSGIYISTGNYASIKGSTLTGRLISIGTTIISSSANITSTITAPQFA